MSNYIQKNWNSTMYFFQNPPKFNTKNKTSELILLRSLLFKEQYKIPFNDVDKKYIKWQKDKHIEEQEHIIKSNINLLEFKRSICVKNHGSPNFNIKKSNIDIEIYSEHISFLQLLNPYENNILYIHPIYPIENI